MSSIANAFRARGVMAMVVLVLMPAAILGAAPADNACSPVATLEGCGNQHYVAYQQAKDQLSIRASALYRDPQVLTQNWDTLNDVIAADLDAAAQPGAPLHQCGALLMRISFLHLLENAHNTRQHYERSTLFAGAEPGHLLYARGLANAYTRSQGPRVDILRNLFARLDGRQTRRDCVDSTRLAFSAMVKNKDGELKPRPNQGNSCCLPGSNLIEVEVRAIMTIFQHHRQHPRTELVDKTKTNARANPALPMYNEIMGER